MQIYDTDEGMWRVSAVPLPYPVQLGMVVPYGNSFLIVGGYNGDSGGYEHRILQFNPEDETWTVRPERLAIGRQAAYAAFVDDGLMECS